MLSFKDYIQEENNIGYEGTNKLTKYRKKMTPGEKPTTPNGLPPEDCECKKCQTK